MERHVGARYKQTVRGYFLTRSGLLFVFVCGALCAQKPEPASINVRIVEGDNAINNIRLHRAREPVVQVVNPAGQPVSGATVTFILPSSGPGGTFTGTGLSRTVQTDAKGLAVGRGLTPNKFPGQFRIRVTASSGGQSASASIVQTNAGAVQSGSSSKKIAIIAVLGGAAIGGAVAALHGGKSASNSGAQAGSASGGTVIVPGDPSMGPPH